MYRVNVVNNICMNSKYESGEIYLRFEGLFNIWNCGPARTETCTPQIGIEHRRGQQNLYSIAILFTQTQEKNSRYFIFYNQQENKYR